MGAPVVQPDTGFCESVEQPASFVEQVAVLQRLRLHSGPARSPARFEYMSKPIFVASGTHEAGYPIGICGPSNYA
jgi:hypothetical protein